MSHEQDVLATPQQSMQQRNASYVQFRAPLLSSHQGNLDLDQLSHQLQHIMGRTRRLWYHLRGSHDTKAQAAGDTTSDLGGGIAQSPIDRMTIAEPDLATEQYRKDTAKDIWLDAYKKLEEDEGTKRMVQAYETLLSNQLHGESISISPKGEQAIVNFRVV